MNAEYRDPTTVVIRNMRATTIANILTVFSLFSLFEFLVLSKQNHTFPNLTL